MKKKTFLLGLFLFIAKGHILQAQDALINKVENPVDWVNLLMGTDSHHSLSNGNVYPAIALPWE